jgi:hypothetical protein
MFNRIQSEHEKNMSVSAEINSGRLIDGKVSCIMGYHHSQLCFLNYRQLWKEVWGLNIIPFLMRSING